MSSKREREPDLIQFRIEYILDDDLPVEKFFMATDARNAIGMFAHSCQKFLSEPDMSDQAIDCFSKAFADQGKPFLDPPEVIPAPEAIPEYERPEGEEEEEQVEENISEAQNTEEEPSEESSPPIDPFMQSEDGEEDGSPPVKENIFDAPTKEEKVDPAIEHAEKKAKREEEILAARNENEKRQTEHENLTSLILRLVEELNGKLSILALEEHNRWVDKWNPLSYPLKEEELVDSEASAD
jgi:hypothetical protein